MRMLRAAPRVAGSQVSALALRRQSLEFMCRKAKASGQQHDHEQRNSAEQSDGLQLSAFVWLLYLQRLVARNERSTSRFLLRRRSATCWTLL